MPTFQTVQEGIKLKCPNPIQMPWAECSVVQLFLLVTLLKVLPLMLGNSSLHVTELPQDSYLCLPWSWILTTLQKQTEWLFRRLSVFSLIWTLRSSAGWLGARSVTWIPGAGVYSGLFCALKGFWHSCHWTSEIVTKQLQVEYTPALNYILSSPWPLPLQTRGGGAQALLHLHPLGPCYFECYQPLLLFPNKVPLQPLVNISLNCWPVDAALPLVGFPTGFKP